MHPQYTNDLQMLIKQLLAKVRTALYDPLKLYRRLRVTPLPYILYMSLTYFWLIGFDLALISANLVAKQTLPVLW